MYSQLNNIFQQQPGTNTSQQQNVQPFIQGALASASPQNYFNLLNTPGLHFVQN